MKSISQFQTAFCGFREEDPGAPDGGGGSDPTAKLLSKIDDNLDEVAKQIKSIEAKAADVPELKQELEALQKAVKNFEGLDSDVKAFMIANQNLETKLASIRTDISGNPLERILQDEEKCALITAPARAAFLRKANKAIPEEVQQLAARMVALSEQKGLTTDATPGSTYIEDEVMRDVYQLVANYGVWNQFDVQRPGSKVAKLPVDTSDPVAKWVTDEGTAETESTYTGSTVTLTIGELIAWLAVSNSLLEDDITGLASRLLTKFSRAMSKSLDFAAITANGGADVTDGGYEGIFDAGTAYVLGSGDTEFADVVYDDFVALQVQSDEALIGNPDTRWLMHPQVLVRLLGIKDSNGRPIFQSALDAPSPSAVGSILGDGIIRSNVAPKAEGASAGFLAYGDTQAMAVAVRKDLEFASSIDAQFTANNTVFRGVMRAGVKLRQATAWEVMTFAAS